MKFEIDIDDRVLAGVIVTAVERGIGYWARNTHAYGLEFGEESAISGISGLPGWACAPLKSGGYLSIDEINEGDGTTLKTHRLGGAALRRGLKRLSRVNSEVFGRVINSGERGQVADARDADIFVQYCLFGGLIYG